MVVNEIYYAKDEMRSIFKHYGKLIHDDKMPYSEKVPYEVFRALTGWKRGIIVREDEKENLWFYENERERMLMELRDEHDFYHFFRAYYYNNHADYVPTTKGDNNMATTIWGNRPKEETYAATNGVLNQSIWDEAVDKASSTSSSSQQEWVNNTTSTKTTDIYYSNAYDGWCTSAISNDVTIQGDLKVNGGNLYLGDKEIQEVFSEVINKKLNKQNEKENVNMKGFNFDFGPCTNDNVRMSMYGIAVKNVAGEWVSYNPTTAQIINVDIFNFDGRKYMFKMPVALKDVAEGDVIVHQKKPMFVVSVEDGGLVVVDVMNGEEKKVIPTANMFGFDFVTKIISMFNAFAAAPTPDAPFGNFLPFMMMNEDSKDFDPTMMMFMLGQNGNMGDMFSNPMLMYFLMKDGNKDSMLPLIMMMGQNQNHKCKCGK